MINLTFDDINNAEFTLYKNNPVIHNPIYSNVAADPSVITPDKSHNGKWHLFCHTMIGVFHYESNDGISFKNLGRIVNRAMRPDINIIDGRYYLFYERTRTLIGNGLAFLGGKWKSEIYCTESTDLKSWTKPHLVIGHTRDFEVDEKGQAISNPFLINIDGSYRLYYSCGQTFIKDCGFCEPTHITYAESKDISKGGLLHL